MDNEMIEKTEAEEQPLEDKGEKPIIVSWGKHILENYKVDEALVK